MNQSVQFWNELIWHFQPWTAPCASICSCLNCVCIIDFTCSFDVTRSLRRWIIGGVVCLQVLTLRCKEAFFAIMTLPSTTFAGLRAKWLCVHHACPVVVAAAADKMHHVQEFCHDWL